MSLSPKEAFLREREREEEARRDRLRARLIFREQGGTWFQPDVTYVAVVEDIARILARGHDWVKARLETMLETEGGRKHLSVSRANLRANYMEWVGVLAREGPQGDGRFHLTVFGLLFLCGRVTLSQEYHCIKGNVRWASEPQRHIYQLPGWQGYKRRVRKAELEWLSDRIMVPYHRQELGKELFAERLLA